LPLPGKTNSSKKYSSRLISVAITDET
jgi:hypothetical protein